MRCFFCNRNHIRTAGIHHFLHSPYGQFREATALYGVCIYCCWFLTEYTPVLF